MRDKAMTIKKAIIYCRVSSKKQASEGHGLQSQEVRCREYAAMRGFTVMAVFMDDITGAASERPAMKAMLEMLRSHRRNETHYVIIDDISRLARDLPLHRKLKAAIDTAGGVLVSPNQQFATGDDPDMEYFESMSALGAEFFRKKNKKQTRDRQRARMSLGYWVFPAPIGYKYEKVEGHGKLLVPVKHIADVIKEAFEGFANGRFETRAEVARFLSDHPRWSGSSRVTVERVTELFSRPHYAGVIDYPLWNLRMVPGKHKPLISLRTYQAVQARITSNALAPARKDINEDFPLRNFVVCDDCGQPYKACWSRGRSAYHPYYLCHTRDCISYGKSVRRDVLESAFAELLTGMKPSPTLVKLITAWFNDLWGNMLTNVDADRAALRDEGLRLQHQITLVVERIVSAKSDSVINAYEQKIQLLETEKAIVDEKIAKCGRALPDFDETYRTALAFVGDPKILWNSNKLEDKRAVLKLAFTERLRYSREHGYRTAKIAKPFHLFSNLVDGDDLLVGDGAGGRNRTDTPCGTGF